jgi:hypothetical protein
MIRCLDATDLLDTLYREPESPTSRTGRRAGNFPRAIVGNEPSAGNVRKSTGGDDQYRLKHSD